MTVRTLDTKWTEGQRDAIRSRGETLLVSAAAGSGKTAVLTERIIDRLLDEDASLNLAEVLVVTFTRAAAAELKTRIRAALDRELARDPENRRLYTQLMQVGRAKICTIDSYCLDLIRANFERLSLSSRISVSDEAQARLLKKTVMNTLIDDYFDDRIAEEGDKIESFGAWCDLFVSAKGGERLSEVLLALYETLNGYEEGLAFLQGQRDAMLSAADTPLFSHGNTVGALLKKRLFRMTDTYLPMYRRVERILAEEGEGPIGKNYGDTLTYESGWLSAFSRLLGEGTSYAQVQAHMLGFTPPRMKSGIRGDSVTEDSLYAKSVHGQLGAELKKVKDQYFSMSEEQISLLCREEARVTEKLYRFLSLFDRRLRAEKDRRGILDFGDMGRYALTLLWDGENRCPTDVARAEADKYTDIFIDEYQDVSPVQDRIFSCIAKRGNRFMVGDAKQSIYAFRGASPAVFLGYRDLFEREPEAGRTIFLSDNFRCDAHVIDCTNGVFSTLFGAAEGGVPYTEADALRHAKQEPGGEEPDRKCVLALLSAEGADASDRETEGGAPTDAEAEASEGMAEGADAPDASDLTEADYIAEEISRLLKVGKRHNGEPIHPRDIAILLRSAKTAAQPLSDALSAKGILSFNNVSRAFFENAEVLLVYSLLCVIDNPQKDVFLAGVLKSPLYRVTLDELIHIRRHTPDGSLYDALVAFTNETGYAKGTHFLERLSYYRHMAREMPVDRFLWMLYRDTGILSLIYRREEGDLGTQSGDPARMRANLMMFYEYARTFESGSFQGLYQFVLFIRDVIEEKAQLPPVGLSGEGEDAVRIMTVHQSKGLEFPVCFIAGMGRKFNTSDLKEPVLLHREAGISTYLRDETGLGRITPLRRELIKDAIRRDGAREEMRILYVAMTRAREYLYMVGTAKNPEKLLGACREAVSYSDGAGVPSAFLYGAENMLTWLLTAYAASPHMPCLLVTPGAGAGEAAETTADTAIEAAAETMTESPLSEAEAASDDRREEALSYRGAKRLIEERFSFVYPDLALTRIPAKTAVSELLKEATSGNEVETAPADREREYEKPRFLTEGEGSLPTPTAAQRGTATHIFLQFCDFGRLHENGIDAELSRLLSKGFIDRETAVRIDRATLDAFVKSDFFQRLCGAQTLYRELRFNLYVPTRGGEGGRLLVQGVIDCIYVDGEGRTVLIDYKTDHFPRTLLQHRDRVRALLSERHGAQLSYYRMACRDLLGRYPDEVRIYSFALGEDFPVSGLS